MKKINYVYKVDGGKVAMPASHDVNEWREFFELLMERDYFAPMHAVIAMLDVVSDDPMELPPSTWHYLYYDTGIEMISDDRYPAYEGAMKAGFIESGLRMIVAAALCKNSYFKDLMVPVKMITECEGWLGLLSEDLRKLALELVDEHESSNGISVPENYTLEWWVALFENAMLNDACACASILDYYLRSATGEEYGIFCPLGHSEYENIGAAMAEDDFVLDAAICSGLMVGAVETYINAALDNYDNWEAMKPGVRHLLDSPRLSEFVPFKERKIANQILGLELMGELEEDAWYAETEKVRESFSCEMIGY